MYIGNVYTDLFFIQPNCENYCVERLYIGSGHCNEALTYA
jgi:hypothetical protein